jgi:hypothetical protein
MESSIISHKTKNRIIIWSENPFTGYISKENEVSMSKRHSPMFITALFTIDSICNKLDAT